jgi:hypothetical protein
MIILDLQILQRTDTKDNWQLANPILGNGERAFEVQPDGTKKEKVGDGVTPYNLLDYYMVEDDGSGEAGDVMAAKLTNYAPVPGLLDPNDTLLQALKKLGYMVQNFTPLNATVISFSAVDFERVTVNWQSVAKAEKYVLYRHSTNNFQLAGIVYSGAGTSFNDINVLPDTSYFYWVVASGYSSVSSTSAAATIRTKIAVNITPAANHVFSNNYFEDQGAYIRKSALCWSEDQTSATTLKIDHVVNVADKATAQIVVYENFNDGNGYILKQAITFKTNVTGSTKIALSPGAKSVRIYEGTQQRVNDQGIVYGAFVVSKTYDDVATPKVKVDKSRVCIVLGDSISVGIGTSNPAEFGFISQLRKHPLFIGDTTFISDGYGYRGISRSLGTPEQTQEMAVRIAARLAGAAVKEVIAPIGTNDYGLNYDVPVNLTGFLADLIDKIRAIDPAVQFRLITPYTRSVESANGLGAKLPEYRNAIASVRAGRELFVQIIKGTDFSFDKPDGLHPSDTGVVTLVNVLAPKLRSTIYAINLQEAYVGNSTRNKVVLVFDANVNPNNGLTIADFTVSNYPITAIDIVANTITLTINGVLSYKEVSNVSGGAGKIQDTNGNPAANVTLQPITNNVQPQTVQVLGWLTQNATLTNNSLEATLSPAAAVSQTRLIAGTAGFGQFTVQEFASSAEGVSVTGTGVLALDTGKGIKGSFTGLAHGIYVYNGIINTIYNGEVSISGIPASTGDLLKIEADGLGNIVYKKSSDDWSTSVLIKTEPITAGDLYLKFWAYLANFKSLNIQQYNLISSISLTDVTMGSSANLLRLVFDGPVNQSTGLAGADFTVTGKVVSSISILSNVVTLILNSGLAYKDSVTITGGNGKVRDNNNSVCDPINYAFTNFGVAVSAWNLTNATLTGSDVAATADNGYGVSLVKLAAGTAGFVQFKVKENTSSLTSGGATFTGTGVLAFDPGATGESNYTTLYHGIYVYNGIINTILNGQNVVTGIPAAINDILKMEADGLGNVVYKRSKDNGATFVTVKTDAIVGGDLYLKFWAYRKTWSVLNVLQSGLVQLPLWTLISATQVGNDLTATVDNAYGVLPTQRLMQGSPGYIQFKVQEVTTGGNTGTGVLGLDPGSTAETNYNTFSYGIYSFGGFVNTIVNGVNTASTTAAALNDILRLEVDTSGTMYYKISKNGGVTFTTIRTVAGVNANLFPKIWFFKANYKILNVTQSGLV